jgi:coenzyme PQQ synthesis protein D (PqqD)
MSAMLSLDRTVRIGDDTVFRELAGEAVLLQLDAGMYYGLDGVGTRLWQLIADRGRLRDVLEQAQREFDVDPVILERDLLALVEELAEKKLVTFD